MKTLRFTLLALLSVIALASCSKKDADLGPDPAASIAGSYPFTSVTIDGGKESPLSGSNASGSAVIERESENLVTLRFDITVAGTRNTATYEHVQLNNIGNNEVKLIRADGNDLGRAGNSKLYFNVNLTVANGTKQALVFIGSK